MAQKKTNATGMKNRTGKNPETIPYHRKPTEMSFETWQVALRKQFVTGKNFDIKKLDGHPVFSDYSVYNPETKNIYKVAIRNNDQVMNFCTCLDFKTNHLGTCKHIEAVLLKIQTTPRLASLLEKGYTPPYTSVYLQYGKERKVRLRIGIDSAVKFKNIAWEYFDNEMTLTSFGYANFEQFLMRASAIDPDFRCYDDALGFILETRENQRRMQWVEERYPDGEELEGIITTKLFPYQQKGILFAAKAGRSMICDEMGLGKTIQAIGLAELMKVETGISSVLIVCPTSLKYQWQSEIGRFTSGTAQVIEGLPHIRRSQYETDTFYKIVSYHALSNDLDSINQMEFDLVILDEAQRIKNWKTKIAQSVKKIRSPYAVVLTGTPLENKLEELYSIVQFVDPFKLGPYYQFLDYYQVKNETGRVIGYNHLHEVSRKLSDIMIRRSKKEVMSQLPERMDKNLFVSMTEEQMNMHEEFGDIVARIVNKWKKLGFLNEQDRQRLMINLNLMRMVCDSTYIVDQQTRYDTKIGELMNIIEEYLDGNNEKLVVFSQWERMTRLVARELDELNIGYRYLNGSVPSRNRKELFDHFNNDPSCRVFLSTDAGSTGLNLQSASMIINLDIPWNPAVLEQRIGRVHRYGQQKKVSVINFVSSGTIEHRMIGVLNFKSLLFDGILNDGEDSIFMGEDKFREFMKTVEGITTTSVTDVEADIQIPTDIEAEADELQQTDQMQDMQDQKEEEVIRDIPGDDDVPMPEPEVIIPQSSMTAEAPDPAALIAGGLGFLSGLARTFSSPEATQKLVSSLVDKDPASGKTYLKIPVENEKVVTDALNLFGQLFKAFGQK
ncbi:MAG: DEAD/DEAH box helicase [Bacteroidales bacterium]|jgi:superfamily II DNA or RNA helicase|nr:DEAD/DEAH box helicase [Bacteroidales bacterium]